MIQLVAQHAFKAMPALIQKGDDKYKAKHLELKPSTSPSAYRYSIFG